MPQFSRYFSQTNEEERTGKEEISGTIEVMKWCEAIKNRNIMYLAMEYNEILNAFSSYLTRK